MKEKWVNLTVFNTHLRYLAIWCEEQTHLKRPWYWERLKAGEGDGRGWDSWIASLTQCTWVWVSSGSWWTGNWGLELYKPKAGSNEVAPVPMQPTSHSDTEYWVGGWGSYFHCRPTIKVKRNINAFVKQKKNFQAVNDHLTNSITGWIPGEGCRPDFLWGWKS